MSERKLKPGYYRAYLNGLRVTRPNPYANGLLESELIQSYPMIWRQADSACWPESLAPAECWEASESAVDRIPGGISVEQVAFTAQHAPETGWVSVKERLPVLGEDVLWNYGTEIEYGHLTSESYIVESPKGRRLWHCYSCYYWMPIRLPGPPK